MNSELHRLKRVKRQKQDLDNRLKDQVNYCYVE